MATLDDLLRFILNPAPGDPSLTAGSDQTNIGVVNSMAAPIGSVAVADGAGGYNWSASGVTAITGDRAGFLTAPATAAATSVQLDRQLFAPAQQYVAVGVGGLTCEIQTVASLMSGNTLNHGALTFSHSAGERVQLLESRYVPAWWFGAVGDGVTDDSAALQAGQVALYNPQGANASRNLWHDGEGRVYALGSPVVALSENRRTQFKFIPLSTFTPLDCDNSLVIEQGGGYSPTPDTFTLSGGTITFAHPTHMATGGAMLFRNTTGMVGAIPGRIYYFIKTTGTTGTLASTVANALATTADVAATAGTGQVYQGLQDIGRSYVEEEYVNAALTPTGVLGLPGVNGWRRNGQQPGFAHKLRVDNTAPCYQPGTVAIINPTALSGTQTTITVKGLTGVGGIATTIPAGTTITVWEGVQSQTWVLSSTANPGDTTLHVNSQAANGVYAANNSVVQVPASVLTPGISGSMLNGTYLVAVSYVNYLGESLCSATMQILMAGTNSLQIASPPAMTNNGDNNIKSSNATGWYAYVSQPNGSTLTRQQPPGSPTPIGTTLNLTAPPTSTGAAPPTISTAGSWGCWLSGQQYRFENFMSLGCDTAILSELAEMFDWFGRMDIEQVASFGVRTLPQNFFHQGGQGLLNWKIAGLHTELNSFFTTNFFDLTNVAAGPSPVCLEIESPWITRAGAQPTGAFINNPTGAGGIIIRNATGTFPGVPGYLIISDPVNGNRDAWTDYSQQPPALIMITAQPSSGLAPYRSIDAIGRGAAQLNGLVLTRRAVNDANYTQQIGDSLIAYTAITVTRSVTLKSAGVFAAGHVLIVVDESGSASGTIKINLTPAASEAINGVTGAAAAGISTARGSLRLVSNGITGAGGGWTII